MWVNLMMEKIQQDKFERGMKSHQYLWLIKKATYRHFGRFAFTFNDQNSCMLLFGGWEQANLTNFNI